MTYFYVKYVGLQFNDLFGKKWQPGVHEKKTAWSTKETCAAAAWTAQERVLLIGGGTLCCCI